MTPLLAACAEVGRFAVKAGLFFAGYGAVRRLALRAVRPGADAGRRVLVVQLDNLGDAVLASGTLRHYPAAFPGKEVWFAIDPGVAPALGALLPNIIPVSRKRLRRDPLYGTRVAAMLARRGFGTVIHHSTIPFSTIEYHAALVFPGVAQCVAYEGEPLFLESTTRYDRLMLRHAYPAAMKAMTRVVPALRGEPAVLTHLRRLLQGAAGTSPEDTSLSLGAEPPRPAGLPEAYAVFGPGAAVAYRRWPVERFARLATWLADRGITPVLVGSRGEAALGREFAGQVPAALNLIGATGTRELLAVIGHARVVVSNETSFAHLAVALRVPSLVIVGGGHLGRCSLYGYEGRNRWLHDAAAPCRGDNWRCGRDAGKRPSPCIESITVEHALAELEGLLSHLEREHLPGSLPFRESFGAAASPAPAPRG